MGDDDEEEKTADRNENQSHENIDENDLSGQCLGGIEWNFLQ